MQRKTASKVIRAKMEEWIETVSDTQLRKDVKDNIIVSGGSIASLLTGEPVNDFDVYLQSRSVLLRLVNYYSKPFPDLQIMDGTKKKEMEAANPHSDASHYSVALRNLKDDQVKIFIETKAGKRIEKKPDVKYTPVYFSPNAISLSDDVQIVIRFHGTVEEIHKTFDFIHATNYWTFNDGIVLNLPAMESLMSRQLKYQGSQYPLTSIIHTRKFIKRKWNIGSGEYLKIMFQISKLDLENIDVLEEQLIGVDVAYFGALIDALRNKYKSTPGFEITDTYLGSLIEAIFDSDNEQD